MSRARRNKFIERWSGREWALRQNPSEVAKQVAAARAAGDIDNATLSYGQDAGLIDSVTAVREVVDEMVAEAEAIIKERLQALVR
jgi:NAD(P)H-dependent flavin oxidoreductase YrpB (nitropropane dioxygenase family)